MAPTNLDRKARCFQQLHREDEVLCLLNAWDVGSARIFEAEGCRALATTSAGVAYSQGRADGELDRESMIEAIARIASACEVPVSADIESGYGQTPGQVAETVRAVIEAGAVGINIEDAAEGETLALRDLGAQCERLGAARAAAEDCGLNLYINGRSDAFLLDGEGEGRVELAIERLRAYAAAGADGVFLPRLVDPDQIRLLVGSVSAPLNVLAAPGTPPIKALYRLGVKRLSTGSSPSRAALALARRMGRELLGAGTYQSMMEPTIPYAEANHLFGS